MSKRKLQIIGYHKDFIDYEDDNVYRTFVCDIIKRLNNKDDAWIQSVLNKEKTEEWSDMLKEYFRENKFISYGTRAAAAESLLDALISEIYDSRNVAQQITSKEYLQLSKPTVKDGGNSEELKKLIYELCDMFKIMKHPDPMVSLEAACIYINKFLSPEFIEQCNEERKNGVDVKKMGFKDFPTGLPDFQDGVIGVAARIMRLLNIETIRDTQTTVNETLVAIQNITAAKESS